MSNFRKSASAGVNAGMLVFIGSMFVGIVNKFMDEWSVTVTVPPPPKKTDEVIETATVD